MKFKLIVASALAILALFLPVFMVHALPSGITIDGNSSDWTAFGLSAVGTDPPYNEPHYYNPVCSDLLEAWACKNDTMLFLMMKVRGGAPDFDEVNYIVNINVNPEENTGDQAGDDYFVAQTGFGGYLFAWNATTLTWNDPLFNSKVIGKAGGLGYIEWGVPLNEIGGNASSLRLDFYTYDRTYSQLVNSIKVTLSPPVTIPEFPSIIMLVLPLTISTLAIALLKKRAKR